MACVWRQAFKTEGLAPPSGPRCPELRPGTSGVSYLRSNMAAPEKILGKAGCGGLGDQEYHQVREEEQIGGVAGRRSDALEPIAAMGAPCRRAGRPVRSTGSAGRRCGMRNQRTTAGVRSVRPAGARRRASADACSSSSSSRDGPGGPKATSDAQVRDARPGVGRRSVRRQYGWNKAAVQQQADEAPHSTRSRGAPHDATNGRVRPRQGRRAAGVGRNADAQR